MVDNNRILPSDRLLFDTDGMDVDAAFAAYRDLYGLGTDVLRLKEGVSARVEGWRLDRLLLYERRLDGIGHRRDLARTQTDGFDHFTATLLLAGELDIEVADAPPRRLLPGEVLLVDTHVPGTNRMRAAHLVTLAIARERMVTIAGTLDRLHGLVLQADEARLFREFVESLLRNLPTMAIGTTMAAASVLTTLLTIAIDSRGGTRRDAGTSRDVERLAALKRMVDARIEDARFTAADVVRESDLSRATLYRLAEFEGGLATLIRNRRMEYIRRQLGDRLDARSFDALAAAMGMAKKPARQAFAERYAIDPDAYRDLASAQTGDGAFLKMRLWQEEVR